MNKEILHEQGIVKKVENGMAEIVITSSSHCEKCELKIFCQESSNFKVLTIKDAIGLNPGDSVTITAKGSKIFLFSLLLYGVPLLILIIGLFFGLVFLNYQEFSATVFSICLVGIYYLLIRKLINRQKNPEKLIKIIHENRGTNK